MTVRNYLLGVDWDNNGDPADSGDDVTSDVRDEPDIAVEWGRDTTQSGSQPVAGSLVFGLDNGSHRYTVNNASSDLYGKVKPGRRVQLIQLDTPYAKLFDGVLDSFEDDPAAEAFNVTCLDGWGRPGAEKLSTPVYRGLRTGDAVHLILDEVGWTGDRIIDPGATVMPWWWEEDTDAATAIEKLVDSEGPAAIAYVEGGTFIFEDRHHRATDPASTTSNGLYTHIIPAGTGPGGDFKILTDSFKYDDGLSRIVNAAVVAIDERRPTDRTVVWSTDATYTIGAGTTETIFARTDEPFINAITPQEGVDFSRDIGVYTLDLSRTSGQSVTITITATSDTILRGMAIRASSVPVVRSFKTLILDQASIDEHGRHSWDRSMPWANIYDARAIASRIVSTYATARPTVTFQIANLDAAYLNQIRSRRISDRITVRNDALGINSDFLIEKIKHTVRKFLIHTVEFTCEVPPPAQPATAFTFDVAGKGFDDGRFGLDGIDNMAEVLRFDVAGQGFNDAAFGW
jgi:hypothetical protein